MQLGQLHKYLVARFPDMYPEISSKVIDGTEQVQVDFKVTLGVNFDLNEINDETIFEDVSNTVRNGLVVLFNKSKEADTIVEPLENILTADPISEGTEVVEG